MAQADWNPWRRLLALPNESRTKTLLVAFLVAAVCALLVSGATVLLRPIQAANRAAEEQARIEALVQGIPGMSDLLAQSGGTLSTVVIDLETGRAAQDVTPATLDSRACRHRELDRARRRGGYRRAATTARLRAGLPAARRRGHLACSAAADRSGLRRADRRDPGAARRHEHHRGHRHHRPFRNARPWRPDRGTLLAVELSGHRIARRRGDLRFGVARGDASGALRGGRHHRRHAHRPGHREHGALLAGARRLWPAARAPSSAGSSEPWPSASISGPS